MTVLHAGAKPVAGRRRYGMKVTLDGGTAEFLEPVLVERAGDRQEHQATHLVIEPSASQLLE